MKDTHFTSILVAKRGAPSEHLYYFPIDIPPFSGYHHDKGFAFYYNNPEAQIPQESVQIPSKEYLPSYQPPNQPNYVFEGSDSNQKNNVHNNFNVHNNVNNINEVLDINQLPPKENKEQPPKFYQSEVTQQPSVSVQPLPTHRVIQTTPTQATFNQNETLEQLKKEMIEYIDNKVLNNFSSDGKCDQSVEFTKLREELFNHVDAKINEFSKTQSSEFLRVDGNIDQLNSKIENVEQEIETLWKSMDSNVQDSNLPISTEETTKVTEEMSDIISTSTKRSRLFEPRIFDAK